MQSNGTKMLKNNCWRVLMPYKKSLAKKLKLTKTIFMTVLIVLACLYFAIILFSKDFRSTIMSDKLFLATFAITWLSILTGFVSMFMDFLLLKKNAEVARDLNDLSFLDKLTGLPNRYSIDRISQKYDSPEKLMHLGCILIAIKNIKEINEDKGRAAGDKVISDFCSILESVGTQYGLIGRNSGNEFLVILENCDQNSVELFMGELGRRIHNHNAISPDSPIELEYSSTLEDEVSADHFYTLITNAYQSFEDNPKALV